MKGNKTLRIISVTANAALLSAGSVILLILVGAGYAFRPSDDLDVAVISAITIFLLFLLFVTEVVAMLRISDSTYHTVLCALFMTLYEAFSPDSGLLYARMGLPFPAWLSEAASGICFLGTVLAFFHFFTFTYRPKGIRISLVPMFAAGAVCGALYAILAVWRLQMIAYGLFVFCAIVCFVALQIRCFRTNTDDLTFALSAAILFASMGMHTMNMLYFTELIPSSAGWSSGYMWFSILCFLSVYLSFIIRTEREARRKMEFQRQVETLKTKVLFEQFKPHFVFNALITVKSMYHRDLDEGDRAMRLLSEYMRDSLAMLDVGGGS